MSNLLTLFSWGLFFGALMVAGFLGEVAQLTRLVSGG
jgi:hypothetical protein